MFPLSGVRCKSDVTVNELPAHLISPTSLDINGRRRKTLPGLDGGKPGVEGDGAHEPRQWGRQLELGGCWLGVNWPTCIRAAIIILQVNCSPYRFFRM